MCGRKLSKVLLEAIKGRGATQLQGFVWLSGGKGRKLGPGLMLQGD